MAKLGDICKFQSGGTPSKSNPDFFGGNIPWITTVALNGGTIGNEDAVEWITDIAIQKSAAKVVPQNSVLVGTRVGIGKVAINSVPMSTSQDVIAMLDIDTAIWNKNFLCKFIQSKNDFLLSQARGATIKGIKIETLSNMQVPDIPINEQCRIATVMDKVGALIAKRQAQLDKLDLLVKARFLEMFGDPVTNQYNLPTVEFGSVLTVKPQNGLYKPQSDYILNGEGTPILRIDGFYNGRVNDFTKLKRLRCSDEELQRYLLKENDIVINRVNSIEYLGKCGLIQGMIESTVYESNMMRLHVDESKFNVRYVVQLLCSQFVYNQILSKAKKSVNQASINQKDVQSLMVYMPSIELQNKFAAFVEQVENMKSGINVSLLKLRTLKKALMQEYFG